MSTYKIYAKKGKKTMPIKLEKKHIYYNGSTSFYLYKPKNAGDPGVTDANSSRGYCVTDGNLEMLYTTNDTTISQGNHEDQRIGNKVNIKGVNLTIGINLNGANLISKLSHGEFIDFSTHWRIMVVKFKKALADAEKDLAEWYRDTYIYYNAISQSPFIPNQSNWMDKKRDSTKWTGQFTILKDKKFVMGKSHTTAQFEFNIGFNKDVNFENTNNNPTADQSFSNIYFFVISPSNNYFDVDQISQDKLRLLPAENAQFEFAIARYNIKTIYYDM